MRPVPTLPVGSRARAYCLWLRQRREHACSVWCRKLRGRRPPMPPGRAPFSGRATADSCMHPCAVQEGGGQDFSVEAYAESLGVPVLTCGSTLREVLTARWCQPSMTIADVRSSTTDESSRRFGPTRFSVVPYFVTVRPPTSMAKLCMAVQGTPRVCLMHAGLTPAAATGAPHPGLPVAAGYGGGVRHSQPCPGRATCSCTLPP